MPARGLDQQQVYALIARLAGQANILTIPRLFIDWAGDHIAALLLSQIVYWSSRTDDPDGWFYKSAKDWEGELGISDYQLARATKKLADAGVQTKLKKVAGAPTLHYRLDEQRFLAWISEKLGNGFPTPSEADFRETGEWISEDLENALPRNSDADPVETRESLTETTAETTSREDNSNNSNDRHVIMSTSDAERIAWYIRDLARELHDQAPMKSSASRACGLFAASGLPLDDFLDLMQAARIRTQRYSASIKAVPVTSNGSRPVKPKMAYFFGVLEDLLGLKEPPTDISPSTTRSEGARRAGD
jgi:hypothetical protein